MGFHDECAVFGIWGDEEAGRMTYLGLYAQQHRGQESTGIVCLDEGRHISKRGMGLVGDFFTEENLEALQGPSAIGHNRYSTTGESRLANVQPLTASLACGPVAIAHNGNIVNAKEVRKELIQEGAIFQGSSDTELVLHLMARHPDPDIVTCLTKALKRLEGAYSMTILAQDRLIAVRDPYGFRPLVLGKRRQADGSFAKVVASETCAFDLIGAEYVGEVQPGEVWWVDLKNNETREQFIEPKAKSAHCIFEHVYFARPDSVVFEESVYESRKNMGAILSREHQVDADLVIPVPDSGVPAALGYSEASGIAFEMGIIRNHYIGRTFIQPSPSIRSFGVKIKLNPQKKILSGKRVIVVDDSLVRGTTSQKIIRLVRAAGATEVHFRVASPPTTGACFYGVDTPKRRQLIASEKSREEICEFIGADTLGYLSVDGMKEAVNAGERGFCAACFTGEYPTDLFSHQ